MFSSKKDPVPQAPAVPPSVSRRATRSGVPSIISADLTVKGTLISTGDVQIDGNIEGDIQSAGLVIGEHAVIHGEIVADEVTIRGRVIGRVRARKVLLCATCHVEGDILHEAFAVESGAYFEGNCRHAQNPTETQPAKPAPQAQVQVAPPRPAAPPAPVGATLPLKAGA